MRLPRAGSRCSFEGYIKSRRGYRSGERCSKRFGEVWSAHAENGPGSNGGRQGAKLRPPRHKRREKMLEECARIPFRGPVFNPEGAGRTAPNDGSKPFR